MDGSMPYFRFQADSWRARLSGLTAVAQVLVLQTAAVGWSETKSGAARMSKRQWARICGCTEGEVIDALSQFADIPWLHFTVEGEWLTVEIPDISKQAGLVTYERDKKRAQRSKGQSPGRIEGSRDRGTEIPAARPARSVGSGRPASDEERHAILGRAQAAIAGGQRQRSSSAAGGGGHVVASDSEPPA